MKTYTQTPSSVHKNLQRNQNNLQFTLECNPQFQCTTLHSSKILNKLQSLKQNVQYIALKKLKSTEVKKKNECTIHNWSMWLA